MAKKMKIADEAEAPQLVGLPDVSAIGFGILKAPTGWLAFRGPVDMGGSEILNPLRHGAVTGEKKETAVARMLEAIKVELLYKGKRAK